MGKVKTHWKKLFNYDYLGTYSLEDEKDVHVTITKHERKLVKSQQDPNGEELPVIYFKEFEKPMVLNPTNAKTIESIYGPFVEDWMNKRITLFVKKGIRAFGTTTDGLRIRPKAPNGNKPNFGPDHKKWNGAIKALKDGNTTIEELQNIFTISTENLQILCDSK